ncbi:hypothetical protein ACOSP7_030376 [Xanthoceras sorbifolium]
MENGYGPYGYGLYRQGSTGVWSSLRDGDFEEEDVWAVLKERSKDSNSIFESQNSVKRSLPSASRIIPRPTIGISNSSSSSSSSSSRGVKQQSAPVSIPDWSKIYDKKSKITFKHHDYDDGDGDGDGDEDDDEDEDEDEDEEDDEYNCKVPPHEFIARRLARSHISSFSVFEGVGRTLKGRDLSKVRNAVLTKTGFLE